MYFLIYTSGFWAYRRSMNILIADKLSTNAVKALEELGAVVRFEPDLGADDLAGAVGDAEVLVVRSTKVKAPVMEAGKALSLIIRAGAGVNTIDLETASQMGIHVANCPGKNADAVAELTVGLMIALDRNIVANTVDLRAGIWNKKLYSKARGIKGRTLGILGFGSIGKRVADIAAAMGMSVIAWSRSLTPEVAEAAGIGYCASPGELAGRADVISVHLAAAKETEHLIDADFLSSVKPGSYIINTSRGEVADSAALLSAAKEKNLKIALDVYEDEPAAGDKEFPHSDLAGMITGTHHIGASTDQAADAIADEVVNIVAAYLESGKPANLVNARDKSPAQYKLVIRHYNKVGVLASVLDELRSAKINIEEMENSIFSGGKAAVCTLKLDDCPDDSVLEKISATEHIIQVHLK
jgi:D-3-phosphoglycerate dehydrogenase